MTKTHKQKILIISSVIFLGFFCLAKTSQAASYYVSPNGTNIWPNCTSQSSPCLADWTTTGKAFLGASAGDTVYFLPGTYSPGSGGSWENPAWNPTNSGDGGTGEGHGKITFKCLTLGTCTLTAVAESPIFGAYNRSYITWDGFTATAVAQMSIARVAGNSTAANYNTIQNCDLTGFEISPETTGNNTIIAGNGLFAGVNYLTIKNNKLHGSLGNDNSAAVLFYQVHNSLVENNDIYNCRMGIYDKATWSGNTHRYNFIHNCTSSGVLLGTESGSDLQDHVYIYQNIFVECAFDALYSMGDRLKPYTYFYNNTIYISTPGSYPQIAIARGPVGVSDVIEIFNNIIVNYYIAFGPNSSDTNTFYDYNNYYNNTYIGKLGEGLYSAIADWRTALGGCPRIGRECYSNADNPNFVNAGGNTAADYKRTSYPTNGRGGSYSNVMGAYITGDEQIGYLPPQQQSDTTPPAAPTGVTVS